MQVGIPHATKCFVPKDPLRKVLHVLTLLPTGRYSRGFDANAKHALLKAIAEKVAADQLDDYQVHWSDLANATRS